MGAMKTPGVYIVEKNAFSNSIVEVETAVPAFVGYTEFADNKGKSLLNQPWKITSMAEFQSYFGGPPVPKFSFAEAKDADAAEEDKDKKSPEPTFSKVIQGKRRNFSLAQMNGPAGGKYLLYRSMQLFFKNGGGVCYIVSVGDYGQDIKAAKLQNGIQQLVREQEPTMLVVPDAVLVDQANCISVQQEMLAHCGNTMKNRFAILDIYNGWKSRQHPDGDCIAEFRNALGVNFLNFSAAYYPWLNTDIVQDSDLSYHNIDDKKELIRLIREELGLSEKIDDKQLPSVKEEQRRKAIDSIDYDDEQWAKECGNADEIATHQTLLNNTLIAMSQLFKSILGEMKSKLNVLPPAAAIAGIYTMVDNSRGVWKAPANVSLSSVVSPTVNITHDDQEDLNVTTQGKSINAIRSFVGEGTLVWGARTLDGNSLDWRYVSVRRTMIMLEESIRLASKAYVFDNNDSNTWVTMRSMISSFLTNIWKRGGLAGASTNDAFSVHVGLGETMTPQDILDGILRITVLVALIRPAEFIEITFQQLMQKS